MRDNKKLATTRYIANRAFNDLRKFSAILQTPPNR
jgi:hypothetical protein